MVSTNSLQSHQSLHSDRHTAAANLLLIVGLFSLVTYCLKYSMQSIEVIAVVLGARLTLCITIGIVMASLTHLVQRLIHSDQPFFLRKWKGYTGLLLVLTTLASLGTNVPVELLESLG